METTGAGTGVGAGKGAQASRTVLKIRCNSSSAYLGTLVAAGEALAGGFAFEGQAGWSDNLSPDSGGREESGKATERAKKGVMKGRSQQRRPRPRIEVILKLIPYKTLFQIGWLTRWVWTN